jgi:hypothetical protein
MEAETPETGTNLTEGDLLELAMKADSNQGFVPDEEEAQSPSETPAEESQTEEQSSEDNDPDQGPETKEAEASKEEESSEESKYAKARKEQERQDRSWKKLEEEKASLRSEREKFDRERQQITQEKAKAKEYRDSTGYTAEDYEKFARETDDPSLAEEASKRADALRSEASEARNKVAQEDFAKGWQENLNALLSQDPELHNRESDIGKELSKVLAERPLFSATPDGIRHAYEFAKARQSASLVSGLKDEVSKLKQENERLNKLTGLSASGPNQKPSPKTFSEMTSKDQERFLERAAAEADGIAY